jgi:4'-phosphopantetheinyl transferase
VHIWYTSLEQPETRVCQCAQLLSEDERKQASRFHFERDRRRFIVSHGVLREILSRYLDVAPDQVQYRHGLRGKPYLAVSSDGYDLQFNMAHSNEVALYAIASGREVGIDLEYVQPIADVEQISSRFFSLREDATLRSLPETQRLEAFFSCWTRKEAYLKAVGDGLTRPLNHFDVSLKPGEPTKLLHVEQAPQETDRWSLQTLVPAPGYVAALCVEGHDWQLACWRLGG